MRMLMNNLDPEVAERPEDLVVYGGTGRAARSWEAYDAIVRTLRTLGDDETLLVQSGKPVAVFRTHDMAPRVLISNSMLVPKWADWETFRALEAQGLTMYGQMTAGSWIYIGTQGILQGTYETLAECAHQHFGGSLAGTVTLTGGLGGMGGAQPLAVTMNDGVALCVEVDPARIERRVKTRYLDRETDDLDEARCAGPTRPGKPAEAVSIGLVGNCAEVLPEICWPRDFRADVVTDQTSAHDPLGGYVPAGLSLAGGRGAAARARGVHEALVRGRWRTTSRRWWGSPPRARSCSTTATTCAPARKREGSRTTWPSATPGSCRRSYGPLFCEGKGPFRWAALSGDPADIAADRRSGRRALPGERAVAAVASARARQGGVPGAAGAHLLARLRRARPSWGSGSTSWWRAAWSRAPIVIGRDHLDAGSVASPNRETEAMLDGSDAIADWPILNALDQHGGRRALGERAPRRRRRHRVLDPRGHGRGGRRIGQRW